MAYGNNKFYEHATEGGVDHIIPEIWSAKSIIALEKSTIIAPLVYREFEGEIRSMGDKVRVPIIPNLSTAQNRQLTAAGQSASIQFDVVDITEFEMDVNVQDYVAVAVTLAVDIQSNRNLLELLTPKMGYAMAMSVDTKLSGHFDTFTNAKPAFQTASALTTAQATNTDVDYNRAIVNFDDRGVPMEGRKFIMSPQEVNALMTAGDYRYVNADFRALSTPAGKADLMGNGYLRDVRGIPVYQSNNLEGASWIGKSGTATIAGHDNALIHTEAVALAMQQAPTTYTDWDINKLVNKIAQVNLYGHKVMRNDHGFWLKGL